MDIVLTIMGFIMGAFVFYGLGKVIYVMLIEFFSDGNSASNVRAAAIWLFIIFLSLISVLAC